ncbi:hypothetical protein EGW08_020729, partial [Elysia chlorotica]
VESGVDSEVVVESGVYSEVVVESGDFSTAVIQQEMSKPNFSHVSGNETVGVNYAHLGDFSVSSQVQETDNTPEFYLPPKIKKRGRPKGVGVTLFKNKMGNKKARIGKTSGSCISEQINKDVLNIKQGRASAAVKERLFEKIKGTSSKGPCVNVEEHVMCFECGREVVDKTVCEQAEFTEIGMCDICCRWYHQFCVSGNSKTKR